MPRTSLLVAFALIACGDNGNVSSASGTGTGTDTDTTSATSTTASTGTSNGTGEPTTGGTMGQTDSASGTDTTATDSGPTTDPTTGTTTMPVLTTTDTTDTTTTTVGPDTDTDTTDGTSTTDTTDGTSTTGTTTDGTSTSTTGTTGTTGEPMPGPCDCPDLEVPLDDGIFVLSDDAELWKYYPEYNDFQFLGAFNCGGQTSTFSMAVDRKGFAWVMLNSPQGDIWKIDVTDPTNCIDPGYTPGQMGVGYFGMAFVSNNQNDQCDRLYGNTYNGIGGFSESPGIGRFLSVDPVTLQLDIISPSDFNGAEMTGTGDGRVFSFGGVPSKLVERDKFTGQVIDVFPLANLPLTNAFAFAFFGGDFYFFTEGPNPNFSKVTHLDYDDSDGDGQQQLTTINNNAPIRIVGAGVSTCAPFLPM